MIKFLDLTSQYRSIKPDIDLAISQTIEEASFIGGARIQLFESSFAAFQQAQFCVGCGNGTDAIEIALEALELPPGSEVIVPANSFISSSEAVTRAGLKVVFADADPTTYTLNRQLIEARLTERTSAIIVVHLYGYPAPMGEIIALAEERGLRVIEDCAQAHGAEWEGRRLGAIGDVGTFSFYPGKNLGAYGDGGAIVTNDQAIADRCRMIGNHGRVAKYDHLFEGRNSRLDGLQAAILSAKLAHLDGWIDKRNEIAAIYLAELGGAAGLTLPTLPERGRHGFHLFVIRTGQRDGLKQHLASHGIESGIHYPIALPKLEAYRRLGLQNADWFANRSDRFLLSLPMGEHLTHAQAREVAHAVRAFVEDVG